MLPKIESPTFNVTLPITKTKVKYRPFTVKEEKILMFAKTADNPLDIAKAVHQVVQNCVINNIDVGELPNAEFEYLFIKLRSQSVNNIVRVQVKGSDNEYHGVDVDLEQVKISKFETKVVVDLNDKYKLKLKYPSFNDTINIIEGKADGTGLTSAAVSYIDSVFNDEEVYMFRDYTEEQKVEWFESLDNKVLEKFQNYANNSPSIEYTAVFEVNGKEEKRELRGLQHFFSFA